MVIEKTTLVYSIGIIKSRFPSFFVKAVNLLV